jgi:hypothetical protein
MNNSALTLISVVIGGCITIAASIVHNIYTDYVARRRLRRALTAEIRAVLDVIEQEQFILKLTDMVNHCRKTGSAGFIPVQFNSHYDDVFRSCADRLALLPSALVERLVAFHYDVQRMIETFQLHQRPLHPDNPFYPHLPEHEAMLKHVKSTRKLGRDLVNELEQPRQ